MRKKLGYVPPRSPYGLIQEDLWSPRSESEWQILVACMMLNCTTRKQVERVIPEFFRRWPTPQALLSAKKEDVAQLIQPLGFMRRRTSGLFKMSERYVAGPWAHVSELPGIGQYAWRSWEIFCKGIVGEMEPTDHALVRVWRWLKERDGNEKTLQREKEEGHGSVCSSTEEGEKDAGPVEAA